LTQSLRSRKSAAELSIIKRAHEMTLEVIRSAASILHHGITTTEVTKFIDDAHRRVGAEGGSFFCIVLFGAATSFPHGVKDAQTLGDCDWVLIDTGFLLHGYNSDITRSFCFGNATDEQQAAWNVEKAAQLAGFDAAILGAPCEVCDAAARSSLEAAGYGPDYQLPGLPHRTGHGCGLDIHERPNLVRGEKTKLDTGMVFSCEPMLVIPDRFGVRLEDHFYMTKTGPAWFTEPCKSVDDPFGFGE
jgi:Xaa-Pro dipeptidase